MNGKRFAGEMLAISVPAGLPVQENIKIVASQVQSQGALCIKLFCPLVAVTSDYSALISRICHPGNRKIRSERSRELCGLAWCALHFIRSINRALLVRRKKSFILKRAVCFVPHRAAVMSTSATTVVRHLCSWRSRRATCGWWSSWCWREPT